MEEKRRGAFPITGGISLLMALIVLAMVVFSLLSLSTARTALRTSRKSMEAVVQYNAADAEAELVLYRLRQGIYADTDLWNDYKDGRTVLCYAIPISDVQELQVDVLPDEDYRVVRWQAVVTGDWTTDDRLDVWDGN